MVIYALKQVWHLDPYLVPYYNVITQATSKVRGKMASWLEVNFCKGGFFFISDA